MMFKVASLLLLLTSGALSDHLEGGAPLANPFLSSDEITIPPLPDQEVAQPGTFFSLPIASSNLAQAPAAQPQVVSFNTEAIPDRAAAVAAGEPIPGGVDFSTAQRTADGRLCVIKESTVQTVSRDPILECTHQDVEKCHYSYVTYFRPAQEEVCEENFEKICQITFRKEATTETVKKCYRPLNKVCNGQGPEQCQTVYESSCTTRYVEKAEGKFVGDTSCEKLPIEICGSGCVTEEGEEECHDKEIQTLIDIPEEICDLNPQKNCRLGTKLAPSLRPEHECTIIPKEVCHLRFQSPRTVDKPFLSEWCLDESPVEPGETYDESNALGSPITPRFQQDS